MSAPAHVAYPAKLIAFDGRNVVAKAPTKRAPSERRLERWAYDGIALATDGCRVEPDGMCPHSHASWLLYLGYV